MKKTELWISRDDKGLAVIWRSNPRWITPSNSIIRNHWAGRSKRLACSCDGQFFGCLCLRIPPNTKCRLRITHYKSGDKLSLVGKPIKAGDSK